MPLAHTAYRPTPVVELLKSQQISAESAAASLESFKLTDDDGVMQVPGPSAVSYKHIPDIIRSLKTDWAAVPERKRPACLFEVRGRIEAHMHPTYLGAKLPQGMRAITGELLHRYNPVLRCAPIGFKRIEPAGSHAGIVAESPYVHFLIEFTAIGFMPPAGVPLLGRLHTDTIGVSSGVNVKLLDFFTLFVPKGRLPAGVRFVEGSGWVTGEGSKQRRFLDEAQPVWVEVVDNGEPAPHGPLAFYGRFCDRWLHKQTSQADAAGAGNAGSAAGAAEARASRPGKRKSLAAQQGQPPGPAAPQTPHELKKKRSSKA